jgi:hypothetical protein
MYRRRRSVREIPFSFDSFLDVVTNVVGIIIRLILVVWVAARSYSGLRDQASSQEPAEDVASQTALEDPLQPEIAQRRKELADLQARLLAQLRQIQQAQVDTTRTAQTLTALAARREQLEQEAVKVNLATAKEGEAAQQLVLSSGEVRRRSQQLAMEIEALEKLPPVQQALRYRTPVSHPLYSEELMFECRHGRVTFIDMGALVQEVQNAMPEKRSQLRRQWQVEGKTPAVGAFRFHYVLERDRGMLDVLGAGGPADVGASFSYGLSIGEVEPITENRGESLERALAAGSEFRQLVDLIDPEQTAVTFWVYPDSFAVFRRLRDYLYERDVMVAGRPLPDGVPIAASRHGSLSRGQ